MQNKNHISTNLLTIGMTFSMCLWGISWSAGKYLTQFCSPVNFVVYRYSIATVTLLLILFATRTKVKIKTAGIPGVLFSGILLALYGYFFCKGLQTGYAGAGGVLVTTLNPIMAYLIGIILSKKLPTRNETIGLVLGAIAGSVLLQVWNKPGEVFESGNLYFLLAAVTWASMSQVTSRGHLYGASLSFSFWQYAVTFICMIPFMDMHELGRIMYIKAPMFWTDLLFMACIVTTLATTMFFYTTTRLGAGKGSSFIFLVPFAAALSAWLFLGEQIQAHTIIGGILGMLAVYMINKKHPAIITEPD